MSEAAAEQLAINKLIKPFEGFATTAYWDSYGGCWTNGYGHTRGVYKGQTCTLAQAEAWVIQDTAWAFSCVQNFVQITLNENQFAALISFEYNTGAARTSGVYRSINVLDFKGACATMMTWDKGLDETTNQLVVVPGLLRRRQAECDFFNGVTK